MRKFFSGITYAMAAVIFLSGCYFYVNASDFYLGAEKYLLWAQYQIACSSPNESSDCARLHADEPGWENGVVITDPDVLFSMAAYFQDMGAAFLAIGSFFIGIVGVVLAASVIVYGQAKTRQELWDAQAEH